MVLANGDSAVNFSWRTGRMENRFVGWEALSQILPWGHEDGPDGWPLQGLVLVPH